MRIHLMLWEQNHGYKSKFVADKMGIKEGSWSRIKRGHQNPTFKQLCDFKSQFGEDGMDIIELFKNVV